jgi:hypothetical protein
VFVYDDLSKQAVASFGFSYETDVTGAFSAYSFVVA